MKFLLPLLLLAAGCGGKQVRELNLTECALGFNEKGEPGGQCSGPDFESQRWVPFTELQHWVAKDPITDSSYWDACYLQRARNGH